MCQLYTAFLFHIRLHCQHSTGLLQRVLLEKECIPAFLPHLRLLYLWIEPGPRQCKGRKALDDVVLFQGSSCIKIVLNILPPA